MAPRDHIPTGPSRETFWEKIGITFGQALIILAIGLLAVIVLSTGMIVSEVVEGDDSEEEYDD